MKLKKVVTSSLSLYGAAFITVIIKKVGKCETGYQYYLYCYSDKLIIKLGVNQKKTAKKIALCEEAMICCSILK